MKDRRIVFACLLLLSGFALAQMDKPAEHRTVGQVLNHSLTNVENEFVPSADAMPEDKYSFAPASGEFKGVRTFAQQIKHVFSEFHSDLDQPGVRLGLVIAKHVAHLIAGELTVHSAAGEGSRFELNVPRE